MNRMARKHNAAFWQLMISRGFVRFSSNAADTVTSLKVEPRLVNPADGTIELGGC